MNICRVCGEAKPHTLFSKNRASTCKPCWAAYMREWRLKNLEKAKANQKRSYRKHAEKRRAHVREYHQTVVKSRMQTDPDLKERRLQDGRNWYWRNRDEALAEDRESRKRRKADDPDAYRAQMRRTRLARFKLSPEQFAMMVSIQGGACAVCGEKADQLVIDHDHGCCDRDGSCGKCVRALLCGSCNRTIGHAREDPERLRAAARYIESYRLKQAS